MTHPVIDDEFMTRTPGRFNAEPRPPEPRPSENRPPDEPAAQEKRDSFLGLSVPQLLGGAGAAVSSAVVASYLGVAGTLIGAALGSIVSTVCAALYTNSLKSAHDKLPPPPRLSGRVEARGVRPPRDEPDHGSGYVVTVGSRGARRARAVRRLIAGMAAVFVLAVATLTAIELGIGHPVSAQQDRGGTSIGTVVGTSPEPAESTPPPAETTQPGQGVTQQPTQTGQPGRDATQQPTAATSAPTAQEPATTQAPAPASTDGAPTQDAPTQDAPAEVPAP